jgi:hypothetical protein
MAVDRGALEELARDELVVEARRIGVKRPEVMTRVELVDEIVRLGTPNPVERKKARGWFGIARDLIASAVEQGLNLPDAAALIRGDLRFEPLRTPQSPVATVTLAEIYGAQGHFARALGILDEVLSNEPEHHVARSLRDKIHHEREDKKGDAPRVPPDPAQEPILEDAVDEPEAATLPPPPREDHGVPPAPPLFDDPSGPDQPDALTLPPPPPRASNGVTPKTSEDAVVLVRLEAGDRLVAYYERGPRGVEAGASVVVRVLEMRPRPFGAERVVRDFPASLPSGTVAIDGVASESVVRASLGVVRHGAFRALAVAAEVRVSALGPEILWTPRRTPTSLAILGTAVVSARSTS